MLLDANLDLPAGFKVLSKARDSGKTKGAVDYYYVVPGTGKKLRSPAEVKQALAE